MPTARKNRDMTPICLQAKSGAAVDHIPFAQNHLRLRTRKSALFGEHEVYVLLAPGMIVPADRYPAALNCIELWANCIVEKAAAEMKRTITRTMSDEEFYFPHAFV